MGRVVRLVASLTVVLLATTALPPRTVDAAPVQSPLYSLTALLSVASDLSGAARGALIGETERIWGREGVKLIWPTTPVDESPSLRILVITRREALAKGGTERWAVGELVPQSGQRALAIASIAAAERVIAEADARRLQLLESHESGDYRLGVVLGRAVAHEIGHYLLATATHANRGLMRASIDASEFADPGARTFTLDDAAASWLRQRLTQTADGSLRSSGFSYAATQAPSVPRP